MGNSRPVVFVGEFEIYGVIADLVYSIGITTEPGRKHTCNHIIIR